MSDIRMNAGAAGAMAQRPYHLAHEPHPENGTSLGFWLYLMSDVLIFAALFATWGVLGRSYAGGATGAELFSLPLVAINTAFLLVSSVTFGMAMLAKQKKNVNGTLLWLAATGLLGLAFVAVELYEFWHIYQTGATIQSSAFLSSFFTLVGTHGIHVSFGLIWLVVLMVQIKQKGLIHANVRRINCLSMFWHFLDVVWIAVFTFVYLMGVL